MKLVKNENELNKENISDKEAEEAFVKILKWMGEDPGREGLLETPKRVVTATPFASKDSIKVVAICIVSLS